MVTGADDALNVIDLMAMSRSFTTVASGASIKMSSFATGTLSPSQLPGVESFPLPVAPVQTFAPWVSGSTPTARRSVLESFE